MTELAVLDEAFQTVLGSIIERAEAPHFTELASSLGVTPEQGKTIQSDLIDRIPAWLHPGTDYIASFPPFNLQPTHYKISIDGKSGWYAQCGLEATAIRWLFPGQTVRVEAPCLDCGEPMVMEMRDEEILFCDPDTIVGYTSEAVGGDAANRPFR